VETEKKCDSLIKYTYIDLSLSRLGTGMSIQRGGVSWSSELENDTALEL
jgi:hypothetical protein